MNTRPDAFSRLYAGCSISAAITSEAIASARAKPVARITAAAIAVAMNAVQIGEDVPVGALDVEAAVVVATAGEDPARQQVDADAASATTSTTAPCDLGRGDEPHDRAVDDQQRRARAASSRWPAR